MDASMREAALWGQPTDGAPFPDADLLLGASLDLGGQPPGIAGLPPYTLGAGGPQAAAGVPAVAAAALFPGSLGAAGQDLLVPMPMIPSGSLGAAGSAGSGGSSGGGGGSVPQDQPPAKPMSKKEIARQKNREKQARFRARQKERKAALEEQYEAAAADLERAKLEHDDLAQRSKLLEAVQSTKDTAVGILSASAPVPVAAGAADGRWQPAPALPAPAGAQQVQQPPAQQAQQADGQAAGVPRSGSGASLGSAPGGGTWVSYILSLSFRERVDLCTSIFRGTASAKQALVDKAGRRPDGFALDIEVKTQLAQQLTDKHPQVLEAALAMTPDMVLQEWASFGDYVTEVINSFDAERISEVEAEKRLVPAVVYQTILNTIHIMHKPDMARQLVANCRLPEESDEAAAARWRQAVIDMGVTREQAAALVPIYRDYCAKEAQLLSESALSAQALREIQQALSQQLLALDQSLSAASLQYLSLFDAAGQLSHQPDAALWILAKMYGAAGAVVSPLQKARLCSLCRPLHPDVPILVREALLLHGLLPDDLGGQRSTSLRSVAAPPAAPALGAGQPRLSLEQARQP